MDLSTVTIKDKFVNKPIRDEILSLLKDNVNVGETFTLAEVRAGLHRVGIDTGESTVSVQLSYLNSYGVIHRVDRGRYQYMGEEGIQLPAVQHSRKKIYGKSQREILKELSALRSEGRDFGRDELHRWMKENDTLIKPGTMNVLIPQLVNEGYFTRVDYGRYIVTPQVETRQIEPEPSFVDEVKPDQGDAFTEDALEQGEILGYDYGTNNVIHLPDDKQVWIDDSGVIWESRKVGQL